MRMPKIISLLLLLNFILCMPLAANTPAQTDKPVTKLIIASSNNFPPINMLDKDGNITGFAHDLSNAVAEALDLEVEYIHSPEWKQVLGWLTGGKANLIHDTGYTEERDQFLDFTQPIFKMDEVIFVHNDTLNINHFDDLAHKKVACVNKHITHHYLKKFPDINCYIVNTPSEGLIALINKNVDAFVYPKEIITYLSQHLALTEHIKIVSEPLRTLEWSMTVNEGNQQLLELLNKGIDQIRQNGQYEKIYQKWYGKQLFSGYSTQQLYSFISISVVASILLVLIIGLSFHLIKMRAVQHTLKQNKEKYRALANEYNIVTNNVPDVIYKVDTNGRLQWWNQKLQTITGLTDKQLTNIPVLELFPAEARDSIQDAIKEVFTKGFSEIKAPLITVKGNTPYEFNGSQLLDINGQLIGLSGSGRDISHQVEIEKEREEFQNQLLQAQKMESIGQLTGGIAHDFNNMLSSILGFSDLAIALSKKLNNEKLDKYLGEIHNAGERARKLVQQMLAFSRKDSIEKSPLKIADVISDSIEILRPTISAVIDLKSHSEENIPLVIGNSVQLEQAIINLCINARDAIGNIPGKIEINLTHQPGVDLTCSSCCANFDGDFVALKISDTGNGIPPDIINKIFEPFFTNKEIGKGSGMGLSMIHGAIHSHSGHIVVDTSAAGTSFTMYLPVAPEA